MLMSQRRYGHPGCFGKNIRLVFDNKSHYRDLVAHRLLGIAQVLPCMVEYSDQNFLCKNRAVFCIKAEASYTFRIIHACHSNITFRRVVCGELQSSDLVGCKRVIFMKRHIQHTGI